MKFNGKLTTTDFWYTRNVTCIPKEDRNLLTVSMCPCTLDGDPGVEARTLNWMHRANSDPDREAFFLDLPQQVRLGGRLAAERHTDRSHAGNFETQLPDLPLKFLGLSQPGLMQELQ